jgi:hypothetical protein
MLYVSYSSCVVDKWQNGGCREKNLMWLTPAIPERRHQLQSFHYLEVNQPLPLNTVFSCFCLMMPQISCVSLAYHVD